MRAAVALALLVLAGCAIDGGVTPSNRRIDGDIDARHRADAGDVRDARAIRPGLEPPTRGSESVTPSSSSPSLGASPTIRLN
jgi:hypothetical protein